MIQSIEACMDPRRSDRSEKELWIDITKRSRCGKMKKFNNIYGGLWDVMEVEILLGCKRDTVPKGRRALDGSELNSGGRRYRE